MTHYAKGAVLMVGYTFIGWDSSTIFLTDRH